MQSLKINYELDGFVGEYTLRIREELSTTAI